MELWVPEQIVMNGTSLALLADVEETARRVNEYRPLPKTVVKRIEDELLGERVYSSNAIEGNTLDLRETVMILKEGLLGAKRDREALEARNLGEAARSIAKWSDLPETLHTREKLLTVHRLILCDIDDHWAGRFREQSAMIRGARYQPPDASLVPSLVDQILERLNHPGAENPLVRAVWAHWALARVHPFVDGNGRLSRLWQDIVLYQTGLTCAIIRPEERRSYLDALTHGDEGDFNPLVQLVAQRLNATFDLYLAEIARDEEIESWATELAGEADERVQQKRELEYVRWKRRMEHLKWEFELCASRVEGGTPNLRIQVRPYPLMDHTKWENLRTGNRVEQTWFFMVEFSMDRRRRRYVFFFGKHYWTERDDERDRSEQRVSLLVSEDDGTGTPTRLDQIEACPLTLREVFVVENQLVRKRVDALSGQLVYDRGVRPVQIAKDFIEEVVRYRLA